MRTLILILTLQSFSAIAAEIAPFTSDGCSSFSNGTFSQQELWLACCEAHDYTYWKGGTYQDRLNADNELKTCVTATGEPKIALLMLAGVRVGGTPYLPTKFRWGFGWPYFRGYKALTHEEIEHIHQLGQ